MATGAVLWFVLSPIPVHLHVVARAPIATEVMGTGTLEARYHATISPKIAGLIAEVFDKAKESLDIATSGVARAGATYAEAQQQIILTQRTYAFQQARLAEAQLLAPFDGLIIERFRDPGSIAVPGTPVLSMISKSELWISAWVNETEMSRLSDLPRQSTW